MKLFKKKTDYGKIIAISLGVVAAVALIAFIIYKIAKKRAADAEYDDLLEECDECDLLCEGEEVVAE